MAVRTIECRVHSPNVDEEADHGHALSGFSITKELVAKDLAGLGAAGHGVDVEIGKVLFAEALRFVRIGEDGLLIVKNGLDIRSIQIDI